MSHDPLPLPEIGKKSTPNLSFPEWIKRQTAFWLTQIATIVGIILYIGTFSYYVMQSHGESHGINIIDFASKANSMIFYGNMVVCIIFIITLINFINDNDHGRYHVRIVYNKLFRPNKDIETKLEREEVDSKVKLIKDFKMQLIYYWAYAAVFYLILLIINKTENHNETIERFNNALMVALSTLGPWILCGCLKIILCLNPKRTPKLFIKIKILSWQTSIHHIIGFVFAFLSCVLMYIYSPSGVLTEGQETIQLVINALVSLINFIVIAMLVSRLDSKSIGIQSLLIGLIFGYAVIQSLTLFAEDNILVASIAYMLAFILKIYFFIVLIYALQTGRMLNFLICSEQLSNKINPIAQESGQLFWAWFIKRSQKIKWPVILIVILLSPLLVNIGFMFWKDGLAVSYSIIYISILTIIAGFVFLETLKKKRIVCIGNVKPMFEVRGLQFEDIYISKNYRDMGSKNNFINNFIKYLISILFLYVIFIGVEVFKNINIKNQNECEWSTEKDFHKMENEFIDNVESKRLNTVYEAEQYKDSLLLSSDSESLVRIRSRINDAITNIKKQNLIPKSNLHYYSRRGKYVKYGKRQDSDIKRIISLWGEVCDTSEKANIAYKFNSHIIVFSNTFETDRPKKIIVKDFPKIKKTKLFNTMLQDTNTKLICFKDMNSMKHETNKITYDQDADIMNSIFSLKSIKKNETFGKNEKEAIFKYFCKGDTILFDNNFYVVYGADYPSTNSMPTNVHSIEIKYNPILLSTDGWNVVSSFLIMFINNLGAMFLLYCYIELFLPSRYRKLNTHSQDIRDKIKMFGMLVFWICLTIYMVFLAIGVLNCDYHFIHDLNFTFNILSGLINGIVFCMLIGRLDDKFFGLNNFVVMFLFAYAGVQPMIAFFEDKPGVMLASIFIAFLGKLFLFAVVYYLIDSERLHRYLINLQRLAYLVDSVYANNFEIVILQDHYNHAFTFKVTENNRIVLEVLGHVKSIRKVKAQIDILRNAMQKHNDTKDISQNVANKARNWLKEQLSDVNRGYFNLHLKEIKNYTLTIEPDEYHGSHILRITLDGNNLEDKLEMESLEFRTEDEAILFRRKLIQMLPFCKVSHEL